MAPCLEYFPAVVVRLGRVTLVVDFDFPVWWMFRRTLHTSCKSASISVQNEVMFIALPTKRN